MMINTKLPAVLLLLLAVGASTLVAHPGHDDPEALLLAALNDKSGVASNGSEAGRVTLVTNGNFRVISANGIPDHAPGQFPNRGNPNRVSAQHYTFRMTLTPQTNGVARDGRGAWFGVALNGVPFEPGTGEFWNGQRQWNFEAKSGFIDLGLDRHNAHVQPTGAYHYHGLPTGLIERLGGAGKTMTLVGYAADGFPIYTSLGYSDATNATTAVRKMRSSWRIKSGERSGGPGGNYDGKFTADYEYVPGSGDLDECNGRFGVTPEYPQGIYHYYLTEEFPQLARQWRGTPDASFFKRDGGPPRRSGPGNRPPAGAGGPPRPL